MSMPTDYRFSFRAAAIVVPHPQKGSRTISPSFEDAEMIRSNGSMSFCA